MSRIIYKLILLLFMNDARYFRSLLKRDLGREKASRVIVAICYMSAKCCLRGRVSIGLSYLQILGEDPGGAPSQKTAFAIYW
jgi:hypothetical protein